MTGRKYVTKINISCQSHNIIYCIECKTCGLQYVGETGRRLMDWFQGHFSTIRNLKARTKTLLHDQFNLPILVHTHHGVDDFNIFVLDFIHMSPTGAKTKQLNKTGLTS